MGILALQRGEDVNGGSSGNGRAITRRFASEGTDIVIADIQESPREGGDLTHELIEAETEARATFVESLSYPSSSLLSGMGDASTIGRSSSKSR